MGTWERPEDMTTPHANITISTANSSTTAAADLVGNAAAALAAASIVWETADTAYAAQALIAAKDLYTFAQLVSPLTRFDHRSPFCISVKNVLKCGNNTPLLK